MFARRTTALGIVKTMAFVDWTILVVRLANVLVNGSGEDATAHRFASIVAATVGRPIPSMNACK